ncbi:hypothetical protein ACWDR9_13870 [Streptosporangium sandarakinum]|uniref:hypothetical protein n=1 Tax=Streptosporangium sandarakinum TaxID=1260955 RepID=UPI0037AD4B42
MKHRRTHRIAAITLNAGSGAQVTHHLYPSRTPVLALDFGALSVLVTTSAGDRVTASDVEFARQLAREADQFARAVERSFHASTGKRGMAA